MQDYFLGRHVIRALEVDVEEKMQEHLHTGGIQTLDLAMDPRILTFLP